MQLLWSQIANTTITEILCSTKMDGIVLDYEHGVFNRESLLECIRVITLSGKRAYIRIKKTQKDMINFAIDIGCHGIILANVDNLFEIEYSMGLVRNNFWGELPIEFKYIDIICQIESVKGIRNSMALYSRTKNIIKYYMIGMYDLSTSCDEPGNFENAQFKQLIEIYEDHIPEKQRGIHLVKNIDTDIEKYKDYGCIAYGLDTLMLIDGAKGLNKYVT